MLGAGLVFLYDVNGLSSEEKLFIYDQVKPPGTMSISRADKHLQRLHIRSRWGELVVSSVGCSALLSYSFTLVISGLASSPWTRAGSGE